MTRLVLSANPIHHVDSPLRAAALAALACLGIGAASVAQATEYGTVIAVTPTVVAVPVPQRQCREEVVSDPRQTSGAGALVGAIAGAALGNQVGGGFGRAAATGIGLVAGSVIGDRVEANGSDRGTATVQRCQTVTRYENRTLAYDVVYDYQGVRRSTRLNYDPGERIALDVQVAPAGAVEGGVVDRAPVYGAPPVYAPPVTVYDEPPVVYAPQRVYAAPVYAAPVYVYPQPSVSIGLGWGWGGGWGGHGGYGGGRFRH